MVADQFVLNSLDGRNINSKYHVYKLGVGSVVMKSVTRECVLYSVDRDFHILVEYYRNRLPSTNHAF